MTSYTLCPPAVEVNLPIITSLPLDLGNILSLAHHPKAGGVVLFSGEIRDHSKGKDVQWLEYEAEPLMAEKMIKEIVATAQTKWGLYAAFCQHRIGKLDIGESAVVVVTAHGHRSESYAANKYIIDRVKHEVPIWKKEYFTDGTYDWGGDCHCHP
ncbi:MAG: molybdenum cofactor biosynthesis protein MoaE [Cytophagales bacterium]|nr:molybdenum cofactor biosynthesis protein MoaE [Cytophagales bacterium]